MKPNKTTENHDAIVYRAAEIKEQIKLLEEEYRMLQAQVMERVKALSQDSDKYALRVGEHGTFTISKYRKWSYSIEIMKQEVLLKDRKHMEEADGTAKATIIEVLKFNPLKENSQSSNENPT